MSSFYLLEMLTLTYISQYSVYRRNNVFMIIILEKSFKSLVLNKISKYIHKIFIKLQKRIFGFLLAINNSNILLGLNDLLVLL